MIEATFLLIAGLTMKLGMMLPLVPIARTKKNCPWAQD
jgi:hypothetical protein